MTFINYVFVIPLITNNFHLIHVLKSKMVPNFKMAAIFTLKGYTAMYIPYIVHIIVTFFLMIFTTYVCGISTIS